jgi:hypothetical protein
MVHASAHRVRHAQRESTRGPSSTHWWLRSLVTCHLSLATRHSPETWITWRPRWRVDAFNRFQAVATFPARRSAPPATA